MYQIHFITLGLLLVLGMNGLMSEPMETADDHQIERRSAPGMLVLPEADNAVRRSAPDEGATEFDMDNVERQRRDPQRDPQCTLRFGRDAEEDEFETEVADGSNTLVRRRRVPTCPPP